MSAWRSLEEGAVVSLRLGGAGMVVAREIDGGDLSLEARTSSKFD